MLITTTIYIEAQNFGGHPSNIKWNQINSKNVRVIYPDSLKNVAKRIADVVEHINKNNTFSVGEKSRKLDIILQTNRVNSNGFVALAPFQSEFFTTGPQNATRLGSSDWLDLLSIHEYRHALQLSNANRGLTKILHLFLGQNGWQIGAFLSLPAWYFEGDATLSETLLSKSGRGRTPSFFIEQRANLLSDKNYSYMTERNGSFKKILPNRYPLGFAITNYTRNKYGMDVWKEIIADAGRYKTIIYPFSGAMKKHTGKGSRKMYKLAYEKLKKDWVAELDSIKLIQNEPVTKKANKVVTNYQFAQFLDDGSIIAIKNSFKEINHLVKIKDGSEKKLTNYGIVPQLFLSENNGVLAWVELQVDARRTNRNYTKIVTYNIKNDTKKYITKKSKYFSPHVSFSGNKIVVVKADEYNKNQIHILDSKNGIAILKIPNPKNDFISYPKWTKNDESIVYIAKRNSELTLVKYDFATKETTLLTNWTSHTIGLTDVGEKHVYFNASFSGIDNIYAVGLGGDKNIKQLSSVKVGAYQPTISKDETSLAISEFTTRGYELSKVSLKKNLTANKTIEYVEPSEQSRYNIKTNANESNILDSIQQGTYETKSYNDLKGIKLHSWGLTNIGNSPMFGIELTNTLRTIDADLGFIYNSNEETTNFLGQVSFGKWFTEIGLESSYFNRSVISFNSGTGTVERFGETNLGASLSVPLNWINGNYVFNFIPVVKYTQHITSEYNNEASILKDLNFGTVTAGTSFSYLRSIAKQNIFPKFGVNLISQYQTSISDITADRFIASGSVFLPGLFKNHSLKIDASWQQELARNEFQFSDLFFYARGYDAFLNDEASRVGFNYALPLAYPDWGFGGLVYFKRIRTNLFYDLGNIKFDNKNQELNSYGFELIFDNKYFNVLPVSIGLRQSFLLNPEVYTNRKDSDFEVFFTINL